MSMKRAPSSSPTHRLITVAHHPHSSSTDDLPPLNPPDDADDDVHIPPSAYSHARRLHRLERAAKRAPPGCFARLITTLHDAFLDLCCWPCRRRAELPGVLTTTDPLQFHWAVKVLDAVGAPEVGDYDPKTYPKSVWGAVLSTLLRVVVLLLIVWYCIQLFTFTTTVNQGLRMQINPLTAGITGQQLDVPTLEFALASNVVFYEEQSSSLQRVDVEDMTGYNPNLASTTSNVPLATAFYQQQTVTLNSFDSELQTVSPDDPNTVQLGMAAQTASLSMHSFQQVTMKVPYQRAQVYPVVDSFYNHTVTLYLRIPQTTLAVLKTCQAQLQLYNHAVYDALSNASVLYDRRYQSADAFPGLVTHDSLWSPLDFTAVKGKASLLQLHSPDWTLVRLQSRMTDDVLRAFGSSTDWGAQAVDVSSYFNLSAAGLSATQGVMTPLSFLDWVLSFSYVNNLAYTYTALSCDGDGDNFDLYYAYSYHLVNATQTEIVLEEWGWGSDYADDFDPQWLPFVILVVGNKGQEEMTVTNITAVNDTTVLTVTRSSTPIDFTGGADDFDCWSVDFPTSVSLLPAGAWTCDVAAYWGNDKCDCGCGVPDPDCCYMYGAAVANCVQGQWCSPAGTCINADVTNGSALYISQSCYVINYPGQTGIAGYVGEETAFHALGGEQCSPCPGDTLYNGQAQLDPDTGLYTCNVATRGQLSGRSNYIDNPDWPQPYTAVNWEVSVHNAHFPTTGFPYAISVGVDVGGGETLYVQDASDVSTSPNNRSLQLLTVATQRGDTNFATKIGMARLVSAMASTSNLLVVIPHPLDPSSHPFSTAGPYSIRAAEAALVVTDASIASANRPYQVLRLQAPPTSDSGYVTYLQQPAQVGDVQVKVAPWSWYWDSLMGTYNTNNEPFPYPSTVPILIRGTQDYSGLEYVQQGNVSAPPTWTCLPGYYHAGDGCDCNCGLWDPDCDDDNSTVWDSSSTCLLNSSCQTTVDCGYCEWVNGTDYPTSRCTHDYPNNPWPIPAFADSSAFYQLISLSSPIKLLHDAGTAVETPVTLSSHPMDFYDSSVGFYDVFTFATVQLSRTAAAFTPDDRYNPHPPEMSTAPSAIPVEVAMFLIPDRAAFNDTPLCPTIPTVNSVQPLEAGLRSVQPDRRMSVQGCQRADISAETVASTCVTVASQEALQDYNRYCILEMPPTHTFSFTTVMPVNMKWQFSNHTQDSGIDTADYSFDFQLVYFFTRDSDFLAAENQFAAGQRANGDIDRNGDSYVFYGQLDEAGPAAANTTAAGGTALPATTPIVNVALTLRPSKVFALADLQRLKPANWPSDAAEQQKLIDSYPSLSLLWDLDVVEGSTAQQQVPLLPGFAYFLTAEVEIVTRYRADVLGRTSISSWTLQTTASSVSLVPLEYFSRQKAVLRYKLTIRDNSYQQLEVFVTPLSIFFGQVGGALAYLAYAVTAVAIIHQLTRWNQRQDLYKKAKERLEKEQQDKAKTESIVEMVMQRARLQPNQAAAAAERPSARGVKVSPAPPPSALPGRVEDSSPA